MDVAMHVPAFYTLPFPQVFTLTYMEYAYLLSIHVRSPLAVRWTSGRGWTLKVEAERDLVDSSKTHTSV